ncbi:MAG TPA: hypothetical protein VIT42_01205 [Microlunatus sp.]
MTGPRGPLWTRARLARVMSLQFGTNALGHADTVAAAAVLGVSPRTVRRWLAGSSGRQLAHIPPRRLRQLIEALQPTAERRRDEQREADYARKAITQLKLPRKRGVLPSWEKRRWTEPHVVAVLAVRQAGIRQLAVMRSGPKTTEVLRRRGSVLDSVIVSTRFHATVLVHEMLTELGPWRFQAKPGSVLQGITLTWLDDAPSVDLAAFYTELGLR